MGNEKEQVILIPLICKENSDLRMFKIIKLLVGLLIIANLIWASVFCAYVFLPTNTNTVTQDTEGNSTNNYIGNDGDVNNGKTDSNN